MAQNHVTLDDKYDLTKTRVFVTGYQALLLLVAALYGAAFLAGRSYLGRRAGVAAEASPVTT